MEPKPWYYWLLLVVFVVQTVLLYFIYREWPMNAFVNISAFFVLVLFLPAFLIFSYKKYQWKHLLLPGAWIVFSGLAFFSPLAPMFFRSLQILLFVASILVAFLLLKKEFPYLERQCTLHYGIMLGGLTLVLQPFFLKMFDSMLMGFGVLFTLPGSLFAPRMCPKPEYMLIDYGLPTECVMLTIVIINFVFFGALGWALEKRKRS